MRILFLDQYSEMGGAQHALLDTLQAVDERGWHAHVLVPGGGPLWDELRARGVTAGEIPCGPYRSRRKSAADSLRFLFDLGKQVRAIGELAGRGGFDLIYVNGPRLLPAVSLAARGHTPVLFHAHSHVRQKSAARLAGWSVRGTAASVVGCSASVLEPLRGFARPERLHVVPNGVRDVGYRQRAFGREGNWRIGMLGRIAPEKGQAEFVHIAALLQSQLPKAEFQICGAPLFGASNSYSEAVQAAARGLPVKFVEWQADVSSFLHGLDLLVVPSKQEGMGRVVVEAFSAGVPVVAFPTGGIPEVVVDRETGFLTREASPQALAERIREVSGTRQDELRRIVLNARRAWQRSYTVAIYNERITRLMNHLASAGPIERETEALPQHR